MDRDSLLPQPSSRSHLVIGSSVSPIALLLMGEAGMGSLYTHPGLSELRKLLMAAGSSDFKMNR